MLMIIIGIFIGFLTLPLALFGGFNLFKLIKEKIMVKKGAYSIIRIQSNGQMKETFIIPKGNKFEIKEDGFKKPLELDLNARTFRGNVPTLTFFGTIPKPFNFFDDKWTPNLDTEEQQKYVKLVYTTGVLEGMRLTNKEDKMLLIAVAGAVLSAVVGVINLVISWG